MKATVPTTPNLQAYNLLTRKSILCRIWLVQHRHVIFQCLYVSHDPALQLVELSIVLCNSNASFHPYAPVFRIHTRESLRITGQEWRTNGQQHVLCHCQSSTTLLQTGYSPGQDTVHQYYFLCAIKFFNAIT
jgi:hypothetical protein